MAMGCIKRETHGSKLYQKGKKKKKEQGREKYHALIISHWLAFIFIFFQNFYFLLPLWMIICIVCVIIKKICSPRVKIVIWLLLSILESFHLKLRSDMSICVALGFVFLFGHRCLCRSCQCCVMLPS